MILHEKMDKGECYVIAELGQNHQGQLKIAKEMADTAAKCGAHAIKTVKRDLTTFKLRNPDLWAMPYNGPNSFGETYGAHREALELTDDDIHELKLYAELVIGMDFVCSFTDIPSMNFLHEIGTGVFKVPSQRLTDYELLAELSKLHVPVILSTGMSNMKEIKTAVDVLQGGNGPECDLYLMQCTSCYPCREADLNLNVMKTLRETFGYPVGFSGHHIGVAPDVAARAMGAQLIERHFTLCRAWKGTDHAASLEPAGLEKVCRYIQQADDSAGSYEKEVLECEIPAMKKLRADLL